MKRTCFECGKNIIFNKDNLDEVIKFGKSYYHYDCFINACKRRSQKSNASSKKWIEALDSIDIIQQETRDYFLKNNDIQKDELYRFIIDNYNVDVLPPYVFKNLEDIYSGKRKNLVCEIPPEDLLDMWQQKINYLQKKRANNIVNGKNLTVIEQINYDMSFLVNKYDGYLKWKEQKKIIEASKKN